MVSVVDIEISAKKDPWSMTNSCLEYFFPRLLDNYIRRKNKGKCATYFGANNYSICTISQHLTRKTQLKNA